MKAARIFVVVCALALLLAEHAGAQTTSDFAGRHQQVFPGVIVKGLTVADLSRRNSTMAASVLVMGLLVLFALLVPQGAPAALGAALAANLALGWLLAGPAGRASRSSAPAPSPAASLGRSCAPGLGSALRSFSSSWGMP